MLVQRPHCHSPRLALTPVLARRRVARAYAGPGRRWARCLQQQQSGGDARQLNAAAGSGPVRGPLSQAATISEQTDMVNLPGAQPGAADAGSAAQPALEESSGLLAQWDALPAKLKAVGATSLAFVICNMDKVNISVAIIPMAQDFGWSPTVAGLVQSSFFYGYLLSQIPGGYVSSLLGGRRVLPAGVTLWSVATAAVPVLAGTIPGLCASRALVGLGEGVAPSAATDIVARCCETGERSRAIAFIFGGLHVGSLLGLLLAPAVIERFGWPAVFYLFGALGVLWSLWWEQIMAGVALREPAVAEALSSRSGGGGGSSSSEKQQQQKGGEGAAAVPWRGFLRNAPVRALAYTHFCNNWFHYTMLAWIPSYFTDVLSLDLTRAAQVSILPPIAAIAVSAIAGPAADMLLEKGVPTALVRKGAQCMAFLGPAACLTAASVVQDSPGSGPLLVGLVALSLGLASFSLAGLYCNHADLSPRYAPVLLGLTNTSGALPGIIGVACTGWLFDLTGSWSLALFAPSIFFFLTGSAAYAAFGSADLQDFEGAHTQPFAVEAALRGWLPERGEGAGEDSEGAQGDSSSGNGANGSEGSAQGPVTWLQRLASRVQNGGDERQN